MAAAGLVTKPQSARLWHRWATPESTAALEELRKFRESLRTVVLRMEAGDSPSAGFLERLNRLLVEYPYPDQVFRGESGWERRKRFSPELPEQLFAPLADAIASLLTNGNPSRIRKCRTCVLHFYDTSKKGTRLWCSMNLCGNRSKVAAFADRRRAATNH
jgi:predicted RNA-binding Zn ribbon-like protein